MDHVSKAGEGGNRDVNVFVWDASVNIDRLRL
jgi:hypothetical protein